MDGRGVAADRVTPSEAGRTHSSSVRRVVSASSRAIFGSFTGFAR